MTVGRRITVTGTVQGVGFRPWVYRVARELGVGGRVRNDDRGVLIDAFGPEATLETFVALLGTDAPGRVRDIACEVIELDATATGFTPEFTIDTSRAHGAVAVSIPPDLSTCEDCLAEMRDPSDRRYRYPFTNCTYCGPRFTIALDLPYDRPLTTMAGFPLCEDCEREYRDPADRRFHAQPIACPRCGPRVWVEPGGGDLADAAARLAAGQIVGIKGLGGFHLACAATSSAAVTALRERKRRDEKPFAVMVADIAAARRLAHLGAADEALLAGQERPIVLVPRRADAALAPEVSPDTPLVGLFLPYTPLHHLLLELVDGPLVMTSGNVTDEPIAKDDDDARTRLAPMCDALLLHDRPIATRCDDSVARVVAGAPMILRRSRGFVPRPIALSRPVAQPILAVGAHLKNTFCLAHGSSAYLGPHIGDLDNALAFDFFAEAIERMGRLVHVRPELVAHDLHPDYPSTRFAHDLGVARIGVQHHHAHIAAVVAEHGLRGPVLGLAWDGVGLGSDGTAWGSELLLVDGARVDRIATLRSIALPGGDAAVDHVWRISLALVDDAFDGAPPPAVIDRLPGAQIRVLREMIAGGIHAPRVHGMGRLFDGVGALCLGRTRARYEGQIAMTWNHIAAAGDHGVYPFSIDRAVTPWQLDHRPLVRAVVADLLGGVSPAVISARFHRTLVDAAAALVRAVPGALPIALGGGCFANPLLVEGILAALGDRSVYLPRSVPAGDGGLALGQVWIAAEGASLCV